MIKATKCVFTLRLREAGSCFATLRRLVRCTQSLLPVVGTGCAAITGVESPCDWTTHQATLAMNGGTCIRVLCNRSGGVVAPYCHPSQSSVFTDTARAAFPDVKIVIGILATEYDRNQVMFAIFPGFPAPVRPIFLLNQFFRRIHLRFAENFHMFYGAVPVSYFGRSTLC